MRRIFLTLTAALALAAPAQADWSEAVTVEAEQGGTFLKDPVVQLDADGARVVVWQRFVGGGSRHRRGRQRRHARADLRSRRRGAPPRGRA